MPELLYLFLTVPTITSFIGWVTNWSAVKMIFWPPRFIGVGPLGWQAIIYKQGHKFATNVADMVINNLTTAEELAQRIDAGDVEKLLEPALDRHNPAICQEVAELVMPGAWDKLPDQVRQMVLMQMRGKNGPLIREVVATLQGMASQLVDLHKLVYERLSGDNVDRLSRLTKKIGHKEFKFIEYSGAFFGFAVGLLQIGVWKWVNVWWTLPIVGAIVGLGTNYLAIEMIFRPFEPRRFLGVFRYQGLFPKRQKDIAHDYGETARDEILTPRVVIEWIKRESGERFTQVVRETVRARLEAEWSQARAMVPPGVPIPDDLIERATEVVLGHLGQMIPEVQDSFEDYLLVKLDVANTVETRLGELSKPDFEGVLRGIFEEDELTLILVGGFLGGAVGLLQAALVLARV